MSADAHPSTHNAAAVDEVVRVLRGARVLTRSRIAERVGARGWSPGMFTACLERAADDGRIVRLTDELYEIAEHEKLLGPESC